MLATRGVVLRTTAVLGRDGGRGAGALSKLAPPLARLGFGGTVGSGRQGMSWIHEVDMNRLFERGLTNDAMQGVYVASSPNPVSNTKNHAQLATVCAQAQDPLALPAFEWMVRRWVRQPCSH